MITTPFSPVRCPCPEFLVDMPGGNGGIFYSALEANPAGNNLQQYHNEIDIGVSPPTGPGQTDPTFAASYFSPAEVTQSYDAQSSPPYTMALYSGFHNYTVRGT